MSKSKSYSDKEYDPQLPVPPDGGWGWFVVLGSFLIHIIADGIIYSFGVFYVEFLHYFGGGKGETALVGSLVPGVTLTVGPIASALTNKYGCRAVTIVGAVIAAIGFIMSVFATNLAYLYFSFGILSGLGFGLMYLPAIVSVGYYFEKRRAFATGIAVCGSGLGAFIFAPVSKYLLDVFDWKGTILIEAGLILNCMVCGALFRPLSPVKGKPNSSSSRSKKEKNGLLENGSSGGSLELRNGNTKIDDDRFDVVISGDSATFRENTENRHNALLQKVKEASRHERKGSLIHSDGAIHKLNVTSIKKHESDVSRTTMGPMYRKDILYVGSLVNIPAYKADHDFYIKSVTSIPDEVASYKRWSILKCFSPEIRDTIQQMLDFNLFRDITFVLFSISNFLTCIGFNMPFIYLPDVAVEAGIGLTDAAFLISVIGIANTAGRLIFGWLGDRRLVNRLMMYSTSVVVCGVATALCPLGDSYIWLTVYAAVFGLTIGVYVSLTSVVLVDLLGLDKLTNSFGILLMFQGVATLIGPPVAGLMYDLTGSYDFSFIVFGIIVAASGAMLYAIPLIRRHKRRKHIADSDPLQMERMIEVSPPQDGDDDLDVQLAIPFDPDQDGTDK